MRAYQVVGNEITDAVVKLGGPFEICKQKREAGQLQPLIDVERLSSIDVAEYLVGQKLFRCEKWLSLTKHMMKRFAGDPDRRQGAHIGLIFEREPQRPWAHFSRHSGRLDFVKDQCEILTLSRRFPLHINEMRHMSDRLKHDQKLRGHLKRHLRLLARRQLE